MMTRNRQNLSKWLRVKQIFRGKPEIEKSTKSAKTEIVHRLSDFQIREIFTLYNKGYTQSHIAKILGVSQPAIRYYLKQGEKQVLHKLLGKNKSPKSKKKPVKIEELQLPEEITIIEEEQTKPQTQAPITEFSGMSFEQKLDYLERTEKYKEEHLLDPEIFPEAPEPLKADPEKFKKRKRSNNALRAGYAKLYNGGEAELQSFGVVLERKRVSKMRIRHIKTEPRDHHGTPDAPNRCPCGHKEPKWVKKQKVQSAQGWIRQNHRQNLALKEYKDKMTGIENGDLTDVAKQAQEGTRYCKECDVRLSVDQARSSFTTYKEYYCYDCIEQKRIK